MKKFFALVCFGIIAFSLAVIGFAHPGGTDGSGGHYNRSTGDYHYHHGYPEHQHPNGECPYNFKDNTEHKDNTNNKNFGFTDSSTEYFFVIIGIALVLVITFFSVRRFYINKKSKKYAEILKIDLARLKLKQATIEEKCVAPYTQKLTNAYTELNGKTKTLKESVASKLRSDTIKLKEKEGFVDSCYREISSSNHKLYCEYFLDKIDEISYSGFPKGVELQNGELTDTYFAYEVYGRFTFYKTSTGVIHLMRGCSQVYEPYHMIYDADNLKDVVLCKKCEKYAYHDKIYFYQNYQTWYNKYENIQRLRDKYNIPRKNEPNKSTKTYSLHEDDTWICNIRG